MIASHDRSKWMGASDASRIVGNMKTKTWVDWWDEKLNLSFGSNFANRAMLAGTHNEHKILRFVGVEEMDKQILLPEYCVRVNYDGNTGKHIYEIKTYSYEKEFKVNKGYWRQCQMEMWAMESDECTLVSYGLLEEDYDNYWLPIDGSRIDYHEIPRDDKFINGTLVPRIEYLAKCLKEGRFPQEVVDWMCA